MGYIGSGKLAITGGGAVSNDNDSRIATSSTSPGQVTVDGAGSIWTNSASLFVGHIGAGTLAITGAGLVSVAATLTIDSNGNGDSFVNMTTGGMLALKGDADDSLAQFLDLVSGTDAIRYWSVLLAGWAPISAATYGDDYTLEYLTTGDLAGYTVLTVGTYPALPGDYNGDGVVDAADYVLWRHTEGTQQDYNDWRSHFGQIAGNDSPDDASVPEPAAAWLLMFGATIAVGMRRAMHTMRS